MIRLQAGKSGLGVVILVSLLICLVFWLYVRERNVSKMRIGVPDSAVAVIIGYVIHEKMPQTEMISDPLDVYPTRDCCTTTSEWALSSGSLAMAVMCPEAAQRLVEKDARYEVIGPCMFNSDIVVVRDGNKGRNKKIAVSQRRDFQKKLVRRLFGENSTAVSMVTSAIPYAYEKRVVDGVVIDVLRGFQLDGEMIASSGDDGDLVTYVLVIRKVFKKNPLYCRFLRCYQSALDELSKGDVLQKAVSRYTQLKWTNEKAKQWKKMNVKFTLPSGQCLQE